MFVEKTDPVPREDVVSLRLDQMRGMHHLRFFGFDTDIQVIMREDAERVRVVSEKVIEAARRYERLFSRFLPHSDIARLNAASGASVQVEPETYDLLEQALFYCEASGGVFDITAGSLTRLWDFRVRQIPNADDLARACAHVNWRGVKLLGRTANGRGAARLADPEASVDLGGIAKGFIADALSDLLLNEGVASHVVCLGGNVVVRGTRDDAGCHWRVSVPSGAADPWWVSVPDAEGSSCSPLVLEVCDCSVVTSGVGERSFEHEGELFHHVIDPCTGWPVRTDLASATVVARRSIDAEGFSTTLLALGRERAVAFAHARPEIVEAHLVTRSGDVFSVR